MVRAIIIFRIYLIMGYVLSLILGGYICFEYLFPMIGRWIVDLNCKMQARIAKLKVDEDKWKQSIEKQHKENVIMQEEKLNEELDSMYAKRWIQEEQPIEEYFETESQIAKVLSKKKEQPDPNDDNGIVSAPWLGQPK